ncbi:hypothetical protein EV363DRAFT_1302221 [Boletus edulis]|nr:hypothetical protein EV363DRAFT_1302221 [Boletus edulis]
MAQSDFATVLQLLEGLTLTPLEASKVVSVLKIGVPVDTKESAGPADAVPAGADTTMDPTITGDAAPPSDKKTTTLISPADLLPTTTIEVDGQARFVRTYKGFVFEVPRDSSQGPFYVITKGHRVGIIDDWGVSSDAVIGVSGAAFVKVASLQAGLTRMLRAIDNGVAKVVLKE